eukprot:gnl/TRDRNA2_/TRDRNA2_166289_c0_seq2.p1 gnl/TRDRNA2_/TRDRNA2_166289_c0~~gnl/TRDRNA2_/TRDRNA2_166289_c0_seq2.p1  ORF type:complete len:222 (-),score=19.66 gnl/TRDRNA2_/TRDRNA2_166289_c0_seq2:496-1161(-)
MIKNDLTADGTRVYTFLDGSVTRIYPGGRQEDSSAENLDAEADDVVTAAAQRLRAALVSDSESSSTFTSPAPEASARPVLIAYPGTGVLGPRRLPESIIAGPQARSQVARRVPANDAASKLVTRVLAVVTFYRTVRTLWEWFHAAARRHSKNTRSRCSNSSAHAPLNDSERIDFSDVSVSDGSSTDALLIGLLVSTAVACASLRFSGGASTDGRQQLLATA